MCSNNEHPFGYGKQVCAAATCDNKRYFRKDLSFFHFPKEKERSQIWMLNSRRKDLLSKLDSKDASYVRDNYYLCAEHFELSQFMNAQARNRLIWNAIPTIFYRSEIPDRKLEKLMEYQNSSKPSVHLPKAVKFSEFVPYNERIQSKNIRILKASETEFTVSSLEEATTEQCPKTSTRPIITTIRKKMQDVQCQTTLTIADMDKLEQQCNHLNEMLGVLNEKVIAEKNCLNEEFFKADNRRVLFYTGFPSFLLLMSLFRLISRNITTEDTKIMSKFQEMTVFLSRLRLNLHIQDLAYRMKTDAATISNIFEKWLHVIHKQLSNFVKFPEHHCTLEDLPKEVITSLSQKLKFADEKTNDSNEAKRPKLSDQSGPRRVERDATSAICSKLNSAVLLVEMFEVLIPKPKKPEEQVVTWTEHKQCHTLKFLICVSMNGRIVHVSKAFGGSLSNNHVLRNSDLKDQLEKGDIILSTTKLVDSGSETFTCLEIGKDSSFISHDPNDIPKLDNLKEFLKKLASHVRNRYGVLQNFIPIDFNFGVDTGFEMVDKMVTISCALINFSIKRKI